jgi:hypothetical protein
MTNRAQILFTHLRKLKNNQGYRGKEKDHEVKIEKWSEIHQAQFLACISILQNETITHAVCEVRERKRNSTLGLLPTISELAEIINQPEVKQPELTASDKAVDDLIKILEEPAKVF